MLRTNNDKLAALFAFAGAGRLNLVAANQAFLGNGEYVSANYFSTIAVPASIGRVINQNDDRAGAAPVAVVSYQLWQHYFNGAANAVGQTVLVNRNAFTIIGVTAPEFFGVDLRDAPDVFLPLHSLSYLDARAHGSNWFVQRDNYWVEVMGRLRSGVTLQQAQVSIAAQFQSFAASNAVNDAERSNLPALWLHNGGSGIDSLRRRYSKPLYVLMAMTGLILAIACANVANLLLARSAARRREIAVRISLGAARSRIMRQLLTESVLLSLLGGLMGMLVAKLGIRFLTFLLSDTLYARIDARVLLFAIVVSGATGIVFGLAPAIQATKVDVMPALKDSRVSALRLPRLGVHLGLSQMLIAGQIASSLLLIIAAGLFVTTLFNLQSVSIGFNKQNLLVFNINAAQAGYDEKRAQIFYESLRRRLSNTPGALAATMSSIALVSNSSDSSGILLPGISAPQGRGPSTSVTIVGPSFFHTMQIPFLHGRPISEQDTDAAARVVVVNEVFAKKYFPGRSPIGEHFAFGFEKPIDVRIIGVAKNSLYSSLVGEVPPLTYLPWSQPLPGYLLGMYYEIRTVGDPAALSKTVRQIVRQADPQLPVAELATQVRYIDSTIKPERTFANYVLALACSH